MQRIVKAKRTGGMAIAVEHLPSQCKALSSNPNTAKKKRKEKKAIPQRMILWHAEYFFIH
jgi:hypothetical protein